MAPIVVTGRARGKTTPRGAKRVFDLVFAALVVAGAFLLVSLVSRRAAAHPFDLDGHDWEGCSDFVHLAREELGDQRVFPTARVDLGALRPEDSVILLHPEKTLDSGSLARFMRAGGRVVLLDDFGTGDGLLEHFGLERVPLPRHPAEALRGNPSLALAEPASAHPVVTEVTRVVTNHATGLRHPDLSPVLKVRGENEPDVLVAIAGAVGQGRLLAVGDPSIVMNSMLRYPGNKTFARALVRYAGDDDTWGKRAGRIVIVAGPFEQKGVYGEESALLRGWGERVRAMAEAARTLRREGLPPWLSYVSAVLVGLAIVVWVGSNAGRTHKAVAPRFTRTIPLAAHGGVAGHAAVISSPRAPRSLAMLELKSALEEELTALLGMEKIPAHDVLSHRVADVGLLDKEGVHELRRILLRMASIETMVLSRRGAAMKTITDGEVVEVARKIRGLLEAARARARGLGESARAHVQAGAGPESARS